HVSSSLWILYFFLNAPLTSSFSTLSLHDALPIFHLLFALGDPGLLLVLAPHAGVGEVLAQADHRFTGPAVLDLGLVAVAGGVVRSEEHTSELQSRENLVCRLLLEKKKKKQ